MSHNEWNHLPIIDWELGTRLAGHHIDLAKDMLMMLTSRLSDDLELINSHYEENNLTALQSQIHKLRGAVAYCGTPRLKAALAEVDQELKLQKKDCLPQFMASLNREVEYLLRESQVACTQDIKA